MGAEAQPQAAAQAPPVQAADDDTSIIDDILGGGEPEKTPGDSEGDDDAGSPDAETDGDEDHASDDSTEDEDEPTGDDDESEDDDDSEDEPDAGALKAARKALADGDIDKAFQLAFGKKPEQVMPDAKAWTKWRAANGKREAAFKAREQQLSQQHQQAQQWVTGQRQQIAGIIEQLRPYEEIHQARLAWQQTGDPEPLKVIIEKTTGMTYDEAQQLILKRIRRSPGERALQQQVQTLMQKLEEAERKKSEEQQQLTAQQQYQADLQIITSQLTGEVTRVPKFAERVYQMLVKTRSDVGLTMTVEEAGRRVLAIERKRLQTHPLLPKKKPKPEVSEAARKLASAKKVKAPPLRRDSRVNAAKDDRDESDVDIINDILKSNNRRRA